MALSAPFVTSGQLGASLTSVLTPSTTLVPYGADVTQFALGQQVTASNNSVWTRVKFGTGGATAAGYVCTFDAITFVAVMMSNSVGAVGDKIGVYAGDRAALSGDYGWLQVYGSCQAIQVNTAVANTALASTSTPGLLDDATGTGTKNLSGIVITTTNAGSAANEPGELNWPVIGTTN